MTLDELLALLRDDPLVVSVQASEGSPADDTETLLRLAGASISQGVRLLRLEGAERVRRIRDATGCAAIGLIKRRYPDSEVTITPRAAEVDALLATGCEVVALDATSRPRPGGITLGDLVARIHAGGALAMGDCDSAESASFAVKSGADLIGTTLGGYTGARQASAGPDLDLVRLTAGLGVPALAEGRFAQRWQIEAALRIGARGVVVGGAINDPVKTTRALTPRRGRGKVGAVDIGGTWIRFAAFSDDWTVAEVSRQALPANARERIDWIAAKIEESEVSAVGISSGGVIDPATGEVVSAKSIIPGHTATRFEFRVPTTALNDGLAAAWAHACLPEAAGRRVATLALGTGVGCGFVADGRIWMGERGGYPRLNDLPIDDSTIEDVLGGAKLTEDANLDQRRRALAALRMCAEVLRKVMFAEMIYVCGGVGLSDWLSSEVESLNLRRSPFGENAGLYGAAALVLFPPEI